MDGFSGGTLMLELPAQKSPVRTRAKNMHLPSHVPDPEKRAEYLEVWAK